MLDESGSDYFQSTSTEPPVPSDVAQLRMWISGTDLELARRANIIFLVLDGKRDSKIAEALGVSRKTVWRWRTRYLQSGIAGIKHERPRTGRNPIRYATFSKTIIETTLNVPAPDGKPWSTRRLAEFLGVSRAMVHRVWKKNGISPNAREP